MIRPKKIFSTSGHNVKRFLLQNEKKLFVWVIFPKCIVNSYENVKKMNRFYERRIPRGHLESSFIFMDSKCSFSPVTLFSQPIVTRKLIKRRKTNILCI